MPKRKYAYKRDALLRVLKLRQRGLIAKVRKGKQGWVVYAYKKKSGGGG